MRKDLFYPIIAMLISLTSLVGISYFTTPSKNNSFDYDLSTPPVSMPLVTEDPFRHLTAGGSPIEERESIYKRWLSVSLKIQVNGASGSGTIIHMADDGWAYVQSCGHLWNGTMTAEEGKKKNVKCKVITWYHNEVKLSEPKEYSADVLYYSNPAPNDCSLLRFKPDWKPICLPIGPSDFTFKEGMRLHSCGCDGGREVAHYDVRCLGLREGDLVTTENSPRPGRSGGGLMTDDVYVGICWGTSNRSGTGNGFFTPLSTIRMHNQKNGYGWLNDVGVNWARQIPIFDRNGPQGKYPKDYIPLPSGNR